MSIYEFKVKTIDGKEEALSKYQGKTLLIVNTASQCGYTKQYDGLEKLYAEFKDKGLVVMGFPSNDFGAQEPGTDAQIKEFCEMRFQIDFPMFSKGPVKGPNKQALFDWLTQNSPKGQDGEIKWNFEKFLIGPKGDVIGRFESKVEPEDPKLVGAIKSSLAN
jgi:glutathione peroxidase